MKKLTINCDMGEAFGIYHLGDDEDVMPFGTRTWPAASTRPTRA
jgi:lactam utilization protein B